MQASGSHFLASRGSVLSDAVAALVDQVAPRLHAWALRYPHIRLERVAPLVMSVAAAAPFATPREIESTARVSLWVFTLDDVMDEELLPAAETADLLGQSKAIAGGAQATAAPGSLAHALLEVRQDLARYELFPAFGRIWADALCATIDEMVRENAWRDAYRSNGSAALPSFNEYAACGRYSIGGPPHIWAEVLTIGDRSACEQLDLLEEMEETASVCIRLANDLRSAEKEAAEGGINSLVIAAHELMAKGVGPTEAASLGQDRVQAEIRQGLQRLDGLQARAATETGRPEAAIADIARFVCEFYASHDYHTFAPAQGWEAA